MKQCGTEESGLTAGVCKGWIAQFFSPHRSLREQYSRVEKENKANQDYLGEGLEMNYLNSR